MDWASRIEFGEVDQPAAVFADDVSDFLPAGGQGPNGGEFIFRHQPAVADYVGVDQRREPAFQLIVCHDRRVPFSPLAASPTDGAVGGHSPNIHSR